MFTFKTFKISQADRHKFCEHIIDSSAPNGEFSFLVILSTLIVALGLIKDYIILVIGGMLVTPLLSPILAISLGIVIQDQKVIKRSVKIFLTAFILAFFIAFITGLLSNFKMEQIQLIKIMQPSLYTFLVALVAGTAASYTWAKPNLTDSLPGVAIAVTLIPPLTAMGLSLASNELLIFKTVASALVLNVFGIILASIIIFSLMQFHKAKKKLVDEVKEEEKEMKNNK
ncbi:MAG: TIGR00341 family protein [Candidatus Pacebacteria bacterium]|nr:TIGR00341 family protein [Candidatus Paceibacterota bacterium]